MNNCNIIRLLNENGIAVEYGQIPDLWHIAQYVIEKGEKKGNPALVNQGKDIISVWHMAHDLKACAEGQGLARIVKATEAEPDETMRLLRIAFAQATALSDNENIYDDNRGDSVPVEYVRKHLNGAVS